MHGGSFRVVFSATLLSAHHHRFTNANVDVYPVCNGMSNQILQHLSRLADAYDRNVPIVMPDAYIYNGVQQKFDSAGNLLDEPLTSENSIPLARVLDVERIGNVFREKDERLEVKVGPLSSLGRGGGGGCGNWLGSLRKVKEDTGRLILSNIAPSRLLREIVDDHVSNIGGEEEVRNGVCVHHRDGKDWHKHCDKWEIARSRHGRKNCREPEGESLASLVRARVVQGETGKRRLLYYVGDHEPPADLVGDENFRVFSRTDVGPEGDLRMLKRMQISTNGNDTDDLRTAYRDLFAVVDFFTCLRMNSFVGNSVSTFSALQIVYRNGYASWYNSNIIPLSDFLAPFPIPIVYTYTEQSQEQGKILLQISIRSVRQKMGPQQPIHILYHGNDDSHFQKWLKQNDVVVHYQNPVWANTIERIRLLGNCKKVHLRSHLYQHQGSYLGTWQRIDMPLFIETEYALYLDADTIVIRPFTLNDFGADLTTSFAISFESQSSKKIPMNAGVSLVNVPKMRETRVDFLAFVEEVATSECGKTFSSPSDQGAIIDFYHPVMLDIKFNMKPYYTFSKRDTKIVHFHGAKPAEYVRRMVGKSLGELMDQTLRRSRDQVICRHLGWFGSVLQSDTELREEYCRVALESDDDPLMRPTCVHLLENLKTSMTGNCLEIANTEYRRLNGTVLVPPVEKSNRLHEPSGPKGSPHKLSGPRGRPHRFAPNERIKATTVHSSLSPMSPFSVFVIIWTAMIVIICLTARTLARRCCCCCSFCTRISGRSSKKTNVIR